MSAFSLRRSAPALLAASGLLASTLSAQRPARTAAAVPAVDSAWFAGLSYRYIGPEGNRVSSVAGVVRDPTVYYAGAASGGIFKTTDGGLHWAPVFDSQPVSSIGAMAVAPSDPNVVWAGTGEPYIRSNISVGWGVFKSTDAGKTWHRAGLEHTGRIGRIAIDPRNPDVVFVAALGTAYGPQPDRGVFRTSDGGKTWEKVLFVDENTGAYDVEMDPTNPRILFATTWQLVIHTWGRTSGGPGSAIWKSTDGGTTWSRLSGKGLPTKPIGKADVAIANSDPQRVYALIETSDGVPLPGFEAERGELWRSDDGGDTWKVASYDRQLAGRTQYYTRMIVAPDNENEAYFLSASWAKTLDGGKTIIDPPFAEVPGGDHHDIWVDPTDANRMIVSHDGGVSITTNRGRTWNQVQLPIGQIYHVTVDNRVPYFVYGNRQDGPSTRGPSNSRMDSFVGIPRGLWSSVGGGESGWATPDPEDPNIVWSSASGFGSVGGIVTRFDVRTGIARSVEVWPEATFGQPAADVKYRFQWTFPLTISPHDHNKVYVGSQFVHVTTDGGNTWRVISPDLTRNDTSRQVLSGALTPDNIGVEYAGVVFAIAESPVQAGVIWAGTNDGLVQLTQDGGGTWTNVTANIKGLLDWGTVSSVEPSKWEAGAAYLTVDGHQVDDFDPWIYRTRDFGRTWSLITAGIPKSPLSYVHWIKQDPVRRGLLYAGTENALYVSFDDGDHWLPLQANLPHAPVYGIALQEQFNDLVVATYGRGFWILDDVTPLQQLTSEVTARPAHLFAPRPAYRFRTAESPFAPFYDPVAGQNPAYGASLNYWLAAQSSDSVGIRILDAGGREVRTLKGPAHPGINRITWDLRFERSKEVRLRTSPLYAPEIKVGIEGMPSPSVGRVAMLAPPGRYTVELSAGGNTMTQTLEVRKDPNTGGTEADIASQVELYRSVATDLDRTVDMINALELVRGQLVSLRAITGDELKAAADSLDRKLLDVEEQLTQLQITGRGQDLIRYPAKLGEKLVYLVNDIGSSDHAPTQPQREVAATLSGRVSAVKTAFDQVMAGDVAQFNALLKTRGVEGIVTSPPPAK